MTQHKTIFIDGARITALRQALKITQAELAERCCVTRTQITNLESGLTDGSVHLLYALSICLFTTSDYLIKLSDNPGPLWESRIETIERLVLTNRTQD